MMTRITFPRPALRKGRPAVLRVEALEPRLVFSTNPVLSLQSMLTLPDSAAVEIEGVYKGGTDAVFAALAAEDV